MSTWTLAWLTLRRSPARAVTLVALIAVAVVVFALVSELSRVSEDGLSTGIARDSGEFGTYEITVDQRVVLSDTEVAELARATAAAGGGEVVMVFDDMPPTTSECPPYENLGEQRLRVAYDLNGSPASLDFGSTAGIDTRWCLDATEIGQSAFFFPDESAQATLGARLYLHPMYRDLIRLSTTGDITRGYVVHTANSSSRETLEHVVRDLLNDRALALGRDVDELVSARRVDADAESVRAAAAGIGVTYDAIRWSVLGLAALALVAMQATATLNRAWFYGLARAVGARTRTVVGLVSIEAGLIALSGVGLALIVLTIASTRVHGFARNAFGVDADVLQPDVVLAVGAGMGIATACAIAVPVTLVLRRDPLEVLEAPRN